MDSTRDTVYKITIKPAYVIRIHQEYVELRERWSESNGSWHNVETKHFKGWKVSVEEIEPDFKEAHASLKLDWEAREAFLKRFPELETTIGEQRAVSKCGILDTSKDLGYFNFLLGEEEDLPPAPKTENTLVYFCIIHYGFRKSLYAYEKLQEKPLRVLETKLDKYYKYGFREVGVLGTIVPNTDPFFPLIKESIEEALDIEIDRD